MVEVGVIGVGMIGQDHMRCLSTVLAGGTVVAVTDPHGGRVRKVADEFGGASVHPSGRALIDDRSVDAVLVCSWGPTREEYVTAAIQAGNPVFCEKPLATTGQASVVIMDEPTSAISDAEVAMLFHEVPISGPMASPSSTSRTRWTRPSRSQASAALEGFLRRGAFRRPRRPGEPRMEDMGMEPLVGVEKSMQTLKLALPRDLA